MCACACVHFQVCPCPPAALKKKPSHPTTNLTSSHACSVLAEHQQRVLIFQFQEGLGRILRRVWEGEGEKKLMFILLFILNVYIFVLYQA